MERRDAVSSRRNPLVKRLRALKARAARADPELALLEGVTLIEEALLSGVHLAEVVASPRAARDMRSGALLDRLRQEAVPVSSVDDALLASLSELETSQGLLALARRPSFDEERMFTGLPLVLVAVGIQNPGNLGGLLRTAEAAGATGVFLTEGTADPFSWKALRGSMGSAFRLPHVGPLPAQEALARLKARRVRVLAAAADAQVAYDRADLRGPVAILLGSEGSGLPEALVAEADQRVSVPMRGAVESLNVGVAAGILLFEAVRQRRG
jgi:TrmH family RNA methyltransferase